MLVSVGAVDLHVDRRRRTRVPVHARSYRRAGGAARRDACGDLVVSAVVTYIRRRGPCIFCDLTGGDQVRFPGPDFCT